MKKNTANIVHNDQWLHKVGTAISTHVFSHDPPNPEVQSQQGRRSPLLLVKSRFCHQSYFITGVTCDKSVASFPALRCRQNAVASFPALRCRQNAVPSCTAFRVYPVVYVLQGLLRKFMWITCISKSHWGWTSAWPAARCRSLTTCIILQFG